MVRVIYKFIYICRVYLLLFIILSLWKISVSDVDSLVLLGFHLKYYSLKNFALQL